MSTKGGAARRRILEVYKLLDDCDEDSAMTTEELLLTLKDMGLKTSTRTLRDDLSILKAAGLVKNVRQQGHAIDKRGAYGLFKYGYFDLWEIKIMLDSVSMIPYIPLETVNKIRKTLLNMTRSDIKKRAEGMLAELPEGMYSEDEGFIDTFRTALDAIIERRVIDMRYFRLGPEKSYVEDNDYALRVHPYAITTLDDYFYLIGYYEQKNRISPFRLDRIREITVTDNKTTDPSSLPIGDKTDDIKNYILNNTSNFMHEKKETLKVKWHPEEAHVSLLYDIMGVDNVILTKNENEYLIRTDQNPGLTANLLRLGPAIEVLGENSLARKKLIEQLSKINDYYK